MTDHTTELSTWQKQRLQYYPGTILNYRVLEVDVPTKSDCFIVTKDTNYEQFHRWRREFCSARGAPLTDKRIEHLYKGYIEWVVDDIKDDPEMSEYGYLIVPKDNPHEHPLAVMAKTRPVEFSSPITLMQLNRGRHWRLNMNAVRESDISFDEKEDRLVFRGACTGRWSGEEGEAPSLGCRWHLAQRLPEFKDPAIDIGFTDIPRMVGEDAVKRLEAAGGFKGLATVEEQLQCKYLLSLEGHDVASGLKWMLRSNCVVLMPVPRIASWLMEDKLTPWKHYVPVAYDMSDLEAKLQWCRDNQDACREIAHESTERLRRFLSKDSEMVMRKAVYLEYAKRVRINTDCPVYEGIKAENVSVQ